MDLASLEAGSAFPTWTRLQALDCQGVDLVSRSAPLGHPRCRRERAGAVVGKDFVRVMAVPRIQSGLMSQKICCSEKRHQSVKTFVLICFNLKLECIFIFCVKILKVNLGQLTGFTKG